MVCRSAFVLQLSSVTAPESPPFAIPVKIRGIFKLTSSEVVVLDDRALSRGGTGDSRRRRHHMCGIIRS